MATRGRTPGFSMSDEHRVKIRNSNILNALIEHVEGKRDMAATQITAGLGLLRKVLPDLSQAEITKTVRHEATDYSREELVALLADAKQKDDSDGVAEADGRDEQPDSVH